MSTPEGARRALAGDLERLDRLAHEARAALVDQRGGPVHLLGGTTEDEITRDFAAAIDDDERLLLAGTFDGVVVGYAMVRARPLRDGRFLGEITELYVEPDARRVGVGAALLDAAVAWCRERGCLGIDAVALPGDRATKNFFEGFGLVARAITAHRSFDEAT